jgi:2Fe-2S ferredoxin
MVKIVIENLDGKELTVNDLSKTVLAHFHDHKIDWMQECGAKGRCTTCMMKVIDGGESLSPPTAAELKFVEMGALHAGERLACQVRLSRAIRIRVPKETMLPHLKYTD